MGATTIEWTDRSINPIRARRGGIAARLRDHDLDVDIVDAATKVRRLDPVPGLGADETNDEQRQPKLFVR